MNTQQRRDALTKQARNAGLAEEAITPTFIDLLMREPTAAGVASLIEDRFSVFDLHDTRRLPRAKTIDELVNRKFMFDGNDD